MHEKYWLSFTFLWKWSWWITCDSSSIQLDSWHQFEIIDIMIYYIVESDIPKNTQWDIFHIFTSEISITWSFPDKNLFSKSRRLSESDERIFAIVPRKNNHVLVEKTKILKENTEMIFRYYFVEKFSIIDQKWIFPNGFYDYVIKTTLDDGLKIWILSSHNSIVSLRSCVKYCFHNS